MIMSKLFATMAIVTGLALCTGSASATVASAGASAAGASHVALDMTWTTVATNDPANAAQYDWIDQTINQRVGCFLGRCNRR
jgi:ABC-type glycerol-3-phosphate transport system substrate-binding protein